MALKILYTNTPKCMSLAKQISPNVSQLMSLLYSESLLWLAFSHAETTRAPLKACEVLHSLSYFADHSQLFLFQPHCCCMWSACKYSRSLDPFYLSFCLYVHPQMFMQHDPLYDWSSCSNTSSSKSLTIPESCERKLLPFLFLPLALRFYMIWLLMDLFILMVCCFCLECELN